MQRTFSMTTIRQNFATQIESEILKNPELITNFVCIVADELSNTDLIRIHQLFFNSKQTVYKKINLTN